MENVPFYIYLQKEIDKISRSADMIERFSRLYSHKLQQTGSLEKAELDSLFGLLQKECRKMESIKIYRDIKGGV